MATVSHLPHVLANVLVARPRTRLAGDEAERLPEVGPSFRDATRVAGANPAIWGDIFAGNREAVAAEVDAVAERLRRAAELLRGGDREALAAWHGEAGERRRELLEAELAGGPLCELRVMVPNRPGIVAELALALGRAGVNIEDMALYPAADMRSGAVTLFIAGERRGRARGGAGPRARPRRQPGRAMRRPRTRSGGGAVDEVRARSTGLQGELRPPPDKSISHRAALIGAMGDGPTRITGYLDSADTRSTLRPWRNWAPVVSEGEPDGHGGLCVEVQGAGLRRRRPGRDRRRQRRHPAADAARLARRAGPGRVDARRRRVDPPAARWTGSPSRWPDGRRGRVPRRRLPPLGVARAPSFGASTTSCRSPAPRSSPACCSPGCWPRARRPCASRSPPATTPSACSRRPGARISREGDAITSARRAPRVRRRRRARRLLLGRLLPRRGADRSRQRGRAARGRASTATASGCSRSSPGWGWRWAARTRASGRW